MQTIWFFDDVNLFKVLCPHKFKRYKASHDFDAYKKKDYIYFEEDSANKVYLIEKGKVKDTGELLIATKDIDKSVVVSSEGKSNTTKTQIDSSDKFSFTKDNTFESIYFSFDSYVIHDSSKNKLDNLIIYANESNATMILIQAYTDSRGSNSYNKKLSIKRALACKKYLIDKGIDPSRIRYIGLGEANKEGDCGDDKDCPESVHQKNRRIDFALTY